MAAQSISSKNNPFLFSNLLFKRPSLSLTPRIHSGSFFSSSFRKRSWSQNFSSVQIIKTHKKKTSFEKLPIGIHSIEPLLKGGYGFVDRTDLIHKLIEYDAPHKVFCRPQGFGKTVLLSALKEIFTGNRNLFKGCYIYQSDYQWPKHPIFHMDLSQVPCHSVQAFEEGLKRVLQENADLYGISLKYSTVLQLCSFIDALATKEGSVVVLIDNFDAPLLKNLDNHELAENIRRLLMQFLGALKGLDIKFTLVTGAYHFSLTCPLLGGPDHLYDLTLNSKFSSLLGYTPEDLSSSPRINSAAVEALGKTCGGYRFSENDTPLLHPSFTIEALAGKAPSPFLHRDISFLFKTYAQRNPLFHELLDGKFVSKSSLREVPSFRHPWGLPTALFQSGCLSIRPRENGGLELYYPNELSKQAYFNAMTTLQPK